MTAAAIDRDQTLIDWLTITHVGRGLLAQILRGPRELRRTETLNTDEFLGRIGGPKASSGFSTSQYLVCAYSACSTPPTRLA